MLFKLRTIKPPRGFKRIIESGVKAKRVQKDGIVIESCVVCANTYGVTEDLKKLGFDVKGMGKPLTEYLKSDAKVLTL